VPVHATKARERVKARLHSFVTLVLDAGRQSTSRPGHLTPVSEPRKPTEQENECGDLGDENHLLHLPSIEPRFIGRPVRGLDTICIN